MIQMRICVQPPDLYPGRGEPALQRVQQCGVADIWPFTNCPTRHYSQSMQQSLHRRLPLGAMPRPGQQIKGPLASATTRADSPAPARRVQIRQGLLLKISGAQRCWRFRDQCSAAGVPTPSVSGGLLSSSVGLAGPISSASRRPAAHGNIRTIALGGHARPNAANHQPSCFLLGRFSLGKGSRTAVRPDDIHYHPARAAELTCDQDYGHGQQAKPCQSSSLRMVKPGCCAPDLPAAVPTLPATLLARGRAPRSTAASCCGLIK